MARCPAELCPNWTGNGCACRVFGIDPPAPIDEEEDRDWW